MGAKHEQARNPISDHLGLRLSCFLGKPGWSLKPLRVRGLWICGVSRRNIGDRTAEVRSACRWRELQCHRRDTNRCFESAGICCGGRCNTPPPYVIQFQVKAAEVPSYFGNATFNGSSGSLPGGFSFTYVNGSPSSDTLTAQFSVAGVNIADDSGRLTLTLQPTEVFGGVRRSLFRHPAAVWLRCFGARTICISMEEAPAKSRGLSVILLDAASSATPTS